MSYSPTPNPFGLTVPSGSDLLRDGDNVLRDLADKISAGFAIVSTLPGSPRDGQIVYFQNAAMLAVDALWQMKYDAGDDVWRYSGGTPMYAEDLTIRSLSGPVVDSASVLGPALDVPLTGDFKVEFGATMGLFSTTAGAVSVGLSLFAGTTKKAEDGTFVNPDTDPEGYADRLQVPRRVALTAGSTLRLRHSVNTAESFSISNQTLEIRPLSIPA